MKQQISSKMTFISKIGVPSFVLFGWATAIFAILFDSGKEGQMPLPVKILFPGIFFVLFAVLFWLSMRLKAVSIDDKYLYVSNYLKEISVPFSNIRDITELRLRGHPVTIHFKEKTEFGEKITFLPKMRFFNFASSHPVVSELKEWRRYKVNNQQNIENNSLAKVPPPSRRIYAFKDLPKEIREKLLSLQNSDGDFLRLSSGATAAKVILLILLSFGFAFFLAAFEFSLFNWRTILVISGGAFVFALWFVYLVRGIFKTIISPIKNRIYLTPTQVIETTDGAVRYRQLKDAGEVGVNKYWNDSGRRSSLDIKFADGDIYQFKMEVIGNSVQLSETKKWQKQATVWRDAAISAARRGDEAYFDSLDIIQKSLMANVPIWKDKFSFLTPRFLFKLTILTLVVFLTVKVFVNFL